MPTVHGWKNPPPSGTGGNPESGVWQPPPEALQTADPEQAAHVAPPVPHSWLLCPAGWTHVIPRQHPDGQVWAVQGMAEVQVPRLHPWPPGHAMHEAPLLPQAVAVSPLRHEPLASTQPLHEVQAPLTQVLPGGQVMHIEPLRPQRDVIGGVQLPFEQQPFAHD